MGWIKQNLPQFIALAVLLLPPLIRALTAGKAKQASQSGKKPAPKRVPSTQQQEAARKWHERQEELRLERQRRIDAQRARAQASVQANATPARVDLEARRRQAIADLMSRPAASPTPQASSVATPPQQPTPRRASTSSQQQTPARPGSSARRVARSGQQRSVPPGHRPHSQIDISLDPKHAAVHEKELSDYAAKLRRSRVRPRTAGRYIGLKIGSIPLNPRTLRQAVILKEVLDPPIALR